MGVYQILEEPKGLIFIWITNKTFEELNIFNWFFGISTKTVFQTFQNNLSRLYVVVRLLYRFLVLTSSK